MQNAELTYNKTLKLRAPLKFDFLTLIAITILSFLFSYKISDYIADFSSIKEKSRVDIFFLVVFFVFLFIPMSNINNDDISQEENRSLAKWKPLIDNSGEINFEFGKEFNEWFNDRFALKYFLANIYKAIKYNTTYLYYESNGKYLNKRNNYMGSIYVSNSPIMYGDNTIKRIEDNIYKLQAFCNKNDIKCYILIAPGKEVVPTELNYPILREKSSNIYAKETKRAIFFLMMMFIIYRSKQMCILKQIITGQMRVHIWAT